MHDLEYYAYLATAVPAGELAKAAVRRLARRAALTFSRRHAPGQAELLEAFCAADATDLALKLAAPRASLFWADASKREALAEVAAQVPGLIGRALSRADAAWRREFTVFGARVEFGRGPRGVDWHLDALHGERFDPSLGADDPALWRPGLDPKAPWAVARFDQALALGQGCWLSPSEEDRARYAHELTVQVRRFEAENPPGVGVNWSSPMEVALRVANLALAFLMMRHRPELQDPAFALCLARTLESHGAFVEAHLEDTGAVPNNHFVANLVGLLHLGAIFPELPRAKAWRELARDGLKREIERQVGGDGFTFEGSTGYHRLSTELFTLALLAARAGRIDLGEAYERRLHSMYRAVRVYLTPAGEAPQIGDNDSGRALPLSDRPSLSHAYLLPLGAALFDDPELKLEGAALCDEAIWLLGPEGLRRFEALPESGPLQAASLPKAGLYFVRSAGAYCSVVCGPNGQDGIGGHSHNDKLSVEIHAGGRPIVVDPGSFCYSSDPALRNAFRATSAHSTVQVDRAEQNRLPETRLFALPDLSRPRALAFESSPSRVRFIGEHRGFERLERPVRHEREVVFDRNAQAFLVVDRLAGKGEHRIDQRWQLPDREVRRRAPSLEERERLRRLGVPALFEAETALELGPEGEPSALLVIPSGRSDLIPALYSPGYGEGRPAFRVETTALGELPLELPVAILLL